MGNQFSFKELEQVSLKTTYPIEANGKSIAAGEIIAYFDNIQLANFREISNTIAAEGGYGNKEWVSWQTTKEVDFEFTQGIFNQTQFSTMLNANLINNQGHNVVISQRETSDEWEIPRQTTLFLKQQPVNTAPIFIYEDGVKLTLPTLTYTKVGNKWRVDGITLNVNKDYIIDYSFSVSTGQTMEIGHHLYTGYLELEGKTKVQDDISGSFRTGIIKIPKLKLMSDLSMRLGSNSSPIVSTLRAKGIPTGARGSERVMEIILLDTDLYTDD